MTKLPDKFTIKDWDVSDRPREKLRLHGASYLSNAELIAILIGSGSAKENAVDLMKRVLKRVQNDLPKLGKMPLEHFVKFNGIGMVKAIKIKAALELSKQVAQHSSYPAPVLTYSNRVYEQIGAELSTLDHEEFWVLYLNQSSSLIEKFRLSQGGITQTVVDIRLALKRAFEVGATSLILVHNHPSGNVSPSTEDRALTQKFKKAAHLVDLKILDHLIVSEKGYFSFADQEIL
ncbi:MAG: DNA repair protein RadC [Flavobacteriaceae bacterium]